jgi:carbamoylphosphate synthase large subunit
VNNQPESGNKSQAGLARVLLTDTDRRPYTARLAVEFARLGCEVSVISTRKHPIETTTVLRRRFAYSSLHPVESVASAITASSPDFIVPCDDRAAAHLYELHTLANRHPQKWGVHTAEVIEKSLGAPAAYSKLGARADILEIARTEGLRMPPTLVVATAGDLAEWKAGQPFPWVLKTDGTWGGRGVKVVHDLQEAEQQFHEMNQPCGFKRALKRLVVNRDGFFVNEWRSKKVHSITAQGFIVGHPANCAVFCWQGKVVAGIAVEVVEADGATGPASIVRVVNNPEMMLAAERIAGNLQLSGFFGLDFIVEDKSGHAYLIEMNPRVTPLCHLRLGKGQDMVGALVAQLKGEALPDSAPVTEEEMIAYFPQAWVSGSKFLESSFADYPRDQPALAQELMHPWPERSLVRRLFTYFSPVPVDMPTSAPETLLVRRSAVHGQGR